MCMLQEKTKLLFYIKYHCCPVKLSSMNLDFIYRAFASMGSTYTLNEIIRTIISGLTSDTGLHSAVSWCKHKNCSCIFCVPSILGGQAHMDRFLLHAKPAFPPSMVVMCSQRAL